MDGVQGRQHILDGVRRCGLCKLRRVLPEALKQVATLAGLQAEEDEVLILGHFKELDDVCLPRNFLHDGDLVVNLVALHVIERHGLHRAYGLGRLVPGQKNGAIRPLADEQLDAVAKVSHGAERRRRLHLRHGAVPDLAWASSPLRP